MLRRFRPDDLEPFVAYRSDPEAARYQSWEAPFPQIRARQFLKDLQAIHPDTPGEWFQFAMALATISAEPPSGERARALASNGMLLVGSSHQAAQAYCLEAVAVARQVGARAVEGHALNTLGVSLGYQGHLEEAITHLERAYAIAGEVGDPEDRFRARLSWAEVLIRNGRCADALSLAAKGRALARKFGAHTYEIFMLVHQAEALTPLGRTGEVDRLMDEALSLDVSDRGLLQLRLTRSVHLLHRGDLPAALADLTAVQDADLEPPDAARKLSLLAAAATWDGRPEEGRAAVAKAVTLFVMLLALPHLAADLGASGTQQLWILDVYGFMVAGLLITMGTLGDRIGRRRLLLIGAAAFGAASILAAYAVNPTMLIAARALLGIAGATLTPSTLSLRRLAPTGQTHTDQTDTSAQAGGNHPAEEPAHIPA